MLQPVVGNVSGIADNIVSVVPVVNQVVPAGTVTSVTAPIVQLAEGTTAAVVDAVVPPVAGTLPALEPVLQPVSDLVTGSALLPNELPEMPLIAVDGEIPADAAIVAVDAFGNAEAALAKSSVTDAPDTASSPHGAAALAGTSVPQWGAINDSGFRDEQPGTADPSPAPVRAPGGPGSGTGSGTASAGSAGSAAFLSPFTFDLPRTGAVRAGETSEHAPAPVSFDPGSSPD
jgi:hypothetical protein